MQQLRARALKLLDALNCAYVIKTPDGEYIVKGDVSLPSAPERKRKAPRMSFVNLYKDHMEQLDSGSYVEVPIPDGVDGGRLLSVISAHGCNRFGRGNVITALNRDKKVVEVARV